MCFVLNEYSDDPDTSADMVGQNVPLPTDGAVDDNDEPWAIEADYRTGWNKTFRSGTYRGMLCGVVMRDYPKQFVSLAKAKSVPTNMCGVPLLGTKEIIDRRNSIRCRTQKQVGRHLVVRVQVDVKSFLTKTRRSIPSS